MFIDGFVHQLPDIDPTETTEWLDSLDAVIEGRGRSRARYLLARLMERGAGPGRRRARDGHDRLHQHDPARAGAVVPGRRGPRAPHPGVHPLERGGDGRPRQPPLRRSRRPPLDVTRRRPRSTRSGSTTSSAGKADGGYGDQVFFQGHAAPGIYARAFLEGRLDRGAARPLPPRGRRRRAAELPAPAAHARLLGVPDGVDGARPAQRGVPGAVQPLPAAPRDRRHERRRRCGASSATARWTSPRRSAGAVARGARAARQPDLRRQLQPAAPRRSGARQRQGHPGARVDRSAARAGT